MRTDDQTLLFSAIIWGLNTVTLHIKEHTKSVNEWILLEGTIKLILTKTPNSANLMIKLTVTLEKDDLIKVRNRENQ